MIKELATHQELFGLVPNRLVHIGICVAQIGRPLTAHAIDELSAVSVPQTGSPTPNQLQVALVVGACAQLFFQFNEISAGIGHGG